MADVSMDTVRIEIESTMSDSTSSIDTLINKLNNLKTSISNVVKESQKLTEFRNNVKSTSSIPNIKTSGGSSKGGTPVTPKAPFAEYGSLQSQLKTLNIDLDTSKAVSSIRTLNSEITKYKTKNNELVTVSKKTKNGLEGVKVAVRDLKEEVKDGGNAWTDFTKGISGAIAKFGLIYTGAKHIISKFGDFVDQAATYEEALNLFTVTMGSYAKEGTEWVNEYSNALFLDPTNVMQYMGSFNSLIKGLGVGSDKAYLMSKNLTQLSYDLSSFKNMSFEEAFRKIQSAISGEIEPLRNVGVALSQNTLQELANSMGIKKRVADMSEAEKAQLRYIQILKSTTEWQGDLGRTLITPANALRVLKQQFTLLAKAIGQIFIPILMTVLPYVMALTQKLTELAKKIAAFFGYEIADIDYSKVENGIGGIGDAAEDTTKKLNTMLAPFDQLNVVQNKNKTNGTSLGDSLGLDLSGYDGLAQLNKDLAEKTEEAKQKLEKILPIVKNIGIAFLSWKLSSSILNFLTGFGAKNIMNLTKLASLSLIIGSLIWDYSTLKTLYDPNTTDDEFNKALVGNIGSTFGLSLGVFGLTKNIYITLIATIVKLGFDIKKGYEDLKKLNPTKEEIWTAILDMNSDFYDWSYENIEKPIVNFFTGFFKTVGDLFKKDKTPKKASQWMIDIRKAILPEIYGTNAKVQGIVGGTTKDIKNKIDEMVEFAELKNNDVTAIFEKNFDKLINKSDSAADAIEKRFNRVIGEIDKSSKITSDNIKDIEKKLNNLSDSSKTSIGGVVGTIENTLYKLKGTVQKNLIDIKGEVNNNFLGDMGKKIDEFSNKFGNIFKNIGKPIAGSFNPVIDAVNNVIKQLNGTKINIPSWVNKLIGNGTKSTTWSFMLSTIDRITGFEDGGYPTKGDLFFANENGIPEMVGRIGNQTAVANNDQIETSLTNALIYALEKSGSNRQNQQRIVVNIGNKKVYEGVGEHIDNENDRYGTNYVKV